MDSNVKQLWHEAGEEGYLNSLEVDDYPTENETEIKQWVAGWKAVEVQVIMCNFFLMICILNSFSNPHKQQSLF